MKINFGCGRGIEEGHVNIDICDGPGVDLVLDFDTNDLPFDDDSADELLMSHVLEHVNGPMHLMQEAWRVSKHDAVAWVRVPHGSSDDAHEDPTHKRSYFAGSFGYFSQPYYWNADYGYRGDWRTESITYFVQNCKDLPDPEVMKLITHSRNYVYEMVAKLRAVKPARARDRSLQTRPVYFIKHI